MADLKPHKSKLQQEKEAWAKAVSGLQCMGIRVRHALPCLPFPIISRWDLTQAAAVAVGRRCLPRWKRHADIDSRILLHCRPPERPRSGPPAASGSLSRRSPATWAKERAAAVQAAAGVPPPAQINQDRQHRAV